MITKVQGCKYIDGSLTLSWLKDVDEFSIRNFSFPDLIEIRGFLKMHHIDNLLSVGDLFPNLAVIHGQELSNKYALQIASCPRLEIVGLSSLRLIGNGSIQVTDNNRNMCFADTIDWAAIAPNATSNNIQASSIMKFTRRKQFVIHSEAFRVEVIVATRLAILRRTSVGDQGNPSRFVIHRA